jgi:DNA polymerase-3 subunit delta'
VVIVDSADEMNPNAANALLKSLEEPPARALFLLVSSEPSQLLPTIRSRCRRLDLSALASEPLRAAAEAALGAADMDAPSAQDWPRLESLAKGSVRKALQLFAGDGLELGEKLERALASLPKLDWAAAHALSDQLAGTAHEQRFEIFYDLLFDALARLIRAAAAGQGEPADLALAERLIAPGQLPTWASAWQELLRERDEAVELNLDRKALVMAAFTRLAAVSSN